MIDWVGWSERVIVGVVHERLEGSNVASHVNAFGLLITSLLHDVNRLVATSAFLAVNFTIVLSPRFVTIHRADKPWTRLTPHDKVRLFNVFKSCFCYVLRFMDRPFNDKICG